MLNKKNIGNLIFILLFVIILFTPVRTYLQRLFLNSPKIDSRNTNIINLNTIDLQLKDYNNTYLNLKDLNNKVVFINYFGTWCPPCIAEMPSLQKLYEIKGKQIEFIFIPINDSKEKVISFMNENNYTLPIYEAQNLIDNKIKPRVFPTVLIFNKQGKLVLKEEGASDWNDKKVHEFLNNIN